SDLPLVSLTQPEVDRLPGDAADVLPLSPLQEGLLFHASTDELDVYTSLTHLDLDGPVDGLRERMERLPAGGSATPFMVVHAAVVALLHRMGAGEDVCVGTPVAGRGDPALDGLAGFFVNLLALRVDVSGGPTFAELLDRARAVDLDAYAHQEVPFERVVEALNPARSLSRHPVFQVLVSYHVLPDHTGGGALRVTGTRLVDTGTAKFDLTFRISERGPGTPLRGEIEYATALFDRETVEGLAARLVTLLETVTRDPHAPLAEVDLVTGAERELLREAWQG
ncbi:condensation domain-containing protein, partial [Streptosporangium algeriense]